MPPKGQKSHKNADCNAKTHIHKDLGLQGI